MAPEGPRSDAHKRYSNAWLEFNSLNAGEEAEAFAAALAEARAGREAASESTGPRQVSSSKVKYSIKSIHKHTREFGINCCSNGSSACQVMHPCNLKSSTGNAITHSKDCFLDI